MTKEELIAELEISATTFKRWCRGLGISVKAQYSQEDLESLQDCRDAMASGVKWRDYLESIGREQPQQTIGDNLISRYGSDIDNTADVVSDRLIQKLDMAVSTKFAKKLSKPSSIFSKVLTVLSSPAPTLEGEADALYLLEAEILDADLEEEFPEAG